LPARKVYTDGLGKRKESCTFVGVKKKKQNMRGMKRGIGMLLIAWLCVACRHEVSDRLMGKWQLQTVEVQGSIAQVDTVWYNFQSESLFMYQIYRPLSNDYFYTYGYKVQPEEHTLKLELTNYTILVKDFLPHTDWPNARRTFTVDYIDGRRLILHAGDTTYTFRRY